jgi:hypothetical protein
MHLDQALELVNVTLVSIWTLQVSVRLALMGVQHVQAKDQTLAQAAGQMVSHQTELASAVLVSTSITTVFVSHVLSAVTLVADQQQQTV